MLINVITDKISRKKLADIGTFMYLCSRKFIYTSANVGKKNVTAKKIAKKMQKSGYMDSVLATLKDGEMRQFVLKDENVTSWRTVASRANKKEGYLKYSVIKSPKLGILVIKCNARD